MPNGAASDRGLRVWARPLKPLSLPPLPVKCSMDLLQFLSNRDMLGAFLLTLAAFAALGGPLFGRHEGVIDHDPGWVLEGDGVIVEREIHRYINARWAGHAVGATRTVHLEQIPIGLPRPVNKSEILRREGVGSSLQRESDIILHLVEGTHAGKDSRNLRAVPHPAEPPLGRRSLCC